MREVEKNEKRNVRPGKHELNLVSLLFYYAYHAHIGRAGLGAGATARVDPGVKFEIACPNGTA